MSRPELVILSSALVRLKKIKPSQALDMIESGDVNIDELRELVILNLQQVKVSEDDNPPPQSR